MNRILLIDDEESIRRVLRMNLEAKGYLVDEATKASEGIAKIGTFSPNLIVLDLGLPDKNGLEVLREIRAFSQIPVIILTVDDDENSKVILLEAGADDYITKPFGPLELMARIHVALRHSSGGKEAPPILETGDLKIDFQSRTIMKGSTPVHLTVTEMKILKVLARGRGQIVQQDQILKEVWGAQGLENPHYIRIYIGHLRKKLERDPSYPDHILTEPGIGYRFI